MKVLLVDDDPLKLAAVRSELLAAANGRDVTIVEAGDVVSAKRALVTEQFDLVVLDVALPMREDGQVHSEAGIDLIDDIAEHPDRYKTPVHVVGITGFQDIYHRVSGRFASHLWSLLYYEPASDSWIQPFQAKVRQLAAAKDVPQPDHGCDAFIVCALQRPELDAVLELPWDWEPHFVANDDSAYWKGSFKKGGRSVAVVASACARMGIAAASIATAKAISHFRPKLLVMTGIAAGIEGKVDLGDVIAGDPCWDWGSGKWISKEGMSHFLLAPHQVGLDQRSRERLHLLARDKALFERIHTDWIGMKPKTAPKLVVGPLATGAAVLADSMKVEEIQLQHRGVLGIEMEAYGVYATAEESSRPRPRVAVLKAVVDFGGIDKDDAHQLYGARVATEVAAEFIQREL